MLLEFDSIATSRGLSEEGTNNRRLLAELLLQLTLHKQKGRKIDHLFYHFQLCF